MFALRSPYNHPGFATSTVQLPAEPLVRLPARQSLEFGDVRESLHPPHCSFTYPAKLYG